MMHDKLDKAINQFKLKYVDMDVLFGKKLEMTKGNKRLVDTVNIFISLESLYYTLRRGDVEKFLMEADKKQIKSLYRNAMSDFINVAAHYREYFNRHRISTNIIYYYNEIPDDYIKFNNSAILDDYRSYFVESLFDPERTAVNGLVAECLPFMELISEYIDGVYMVGTKFVESSLVPYIILMENVFPANMNIMITKDIYDYNYVNNNFLVITKYKNYPVVLTKYNLMRFLDHKYDWSKKDDKFELNSKLFPFILATIGEKKRTIPGIYGVGYKNIKKALLKLYEVGYIFNEDPETMSFNNLCEVISSSSPNIIKNSVFLDDLSRGYRVQDFEYQYRILSKSQKEDILSRLKNKFDYAALTELNDKYFEYYPLMLMELERYDKKYDTKVFNSLND
jgi:hypothetical protein